MKISSETIEILKNFSTINQSLLIKPGKTQKTVRSPQRNIFAQAELKDEFPIECAIYELPKFLSAISLFEKADLDFKENFVEISGEGYHKVKYFYAAASLLGTPIPDKGLEFDETIDSFSLSQNDLLKLNKASAIMGIPDFVVEKSGKKRSIKVCNLKNKSSNTFTISQDSTKGEDYTIVLNSENLKIIPGDYEITVGRIKTINIVQFTSNNVTYFIAAEA